MAYAILFSYVEFRTGSALYFFRTFLYNSNGIVPGTHRATIPICKTCFHEGVDDLKLLFKSCRGYYHQLFLGPIFKLMEAIFELLVPLIMADIIDVGIAAGDSAYVLRQGLLLLILAVLGIISATICQYFASVAAFGVGASLRSRVFHHIMELSGKELDSIGSGSLITHITNDVNQVQNGLNMLIRLATRAPFLTIGSILMAFRINPRIAITFLVFTPMIVAVLYWIMKHTLPDYVHIQNKQDNLGALVGENLKGTRVIRAFSRQNSEKQGFDRANDALSRLTIRVGKISGALNPLTYLIANFGIIALLWYGAQFTDRGLMLPGEVFAMVNYMTQTLLALILLSNLIVQFTRAIASGRRLTTLLETKPSIQGESVPKAKKETSFLQFENVDFAYISGHPTLSDINFTVKAGSTVGIIGGTGCGKTTLVNLLLRFYDVDSGRILLDGLDIRSYPLSELRDKVGYVPQTVNLFSGTIRSNLSIGKPDATDEELWRALEIAQSASFVRLDPAGLDAPVEQGGKNFSGGQRQRLTIARALVQHPPLLILDDSFSALDFATDATLRKALKETTENTTVLMISQRASTIKNADQIIVMDDGQIVGQGTHETLFEHCPVYREICISQNITAETNSSAHSESEAVLS